MSSKVLICGSGNTAQFLAGLLSENADIELRVFTRSSEKARHWNHAIAKTGLRVTTTQGTTRREIVNSDLHITDHPKVAEDCDAIILAVPAFGHANYLELLAPYIENGAAIVGLPGQCGFQNEVHRVLGDKPVVIVNFESSPWSCRIVEFGSHVKSLGTKRKVNGAMCGQLSSSRIQNPLAYLKSLLSKWTEVVESPCMLSIDLMSVNAYTHPPIMYATWKDWDGRPMSKPPLFYHGIDEATGELLVRLSEEVVAISRRIKQLHPNTDLSHVVPMLTWDRNTYSHEIKDSSNQYTALTTNVGYRGLAHPMLLDDSNTWVPDFDHRYLNEDVPFGLVPIRGIAELAGVDTPYIDEVLHWCQIRMGKQYLSDNGMLGVDISSTTCPQRYGFNKLEQLL